ncbi:hypothetical protein H112_01207 [Trichophyton rubrum D6]|uniref:MSP domain-containing protein n=7 Tax=Trichophyton TaxID=5550 RepID=A0A178F5D6_TRIRU|nr:uncharacterized protein TERG_07621 [Trichophyton rubrum CBS 118892]EZF26658.1 hypothetical protein H100_01200 [Trichophyton rubrum MR850]EZF45764.1 hypothetical protein H102_01197 [Trichophyton rubrum CBS 100081]EZF56338.1 hypothetical protein H103_01204 [Trichophyton rubrum CBS 288.86]EZF66921.1 hypothetical protein H104_01190 [Trichophyton rubrum CBS 289.86]EZF77734.1 hypothetical protein H105_01210 [Trichophyton soudanense CBS 452.61]EZF88266.1 hypothetical protein H110_01207 [Trichophy
MSVEIEPGELGFKRPFTKEVTEILYLRNPNSDPVAFKVKTTAPKHYCVRPNSGRIEPGKQVEVQVLLQAMKEDPPLDAKCRDKFLVQSVAVSADKEFSNVASIWQDVEKKSKSLIQERKIRVNFLPSDDSHTNGVEPDSEPHAQSSPHAPQFTTPVVQRTVGSGPTPPKSEDMKHESPPEPSSEPTNTFGMATSSTRVEPSQSSDDLLSSQLAEARLQIKQLQQQIADNEVRQRKKPVEGGELSTNQSSLKQAQPPTQLAAAGGVPLQAVAGLCLLSFLLAYIFF